MVSDDCKACGRCILACPQKAIEFDIHDDEFFRNAIKEISVRVDLE